MAKKKKGASLLLEWIMWMATLVVSLAVGFATVKGVLSIPYIPATIMVIAGWVVIFAAAFAAVMKVSDLVK